MAAVTTAPPHKRYTADFKAIGGRLLHEHVPVLIEQWDDFISELGARWWGGELTRMKAWLLMTRVKPGTVTLYAPAEDSPHRGTVVSGSIMTVKHGIVDFDIVQVNVDSFECAIHLPHMSGLGTTLHLANAWMNVRECGVARLAKQDLEAGLIKEPYLAEELQRPPPLVASATRAGIDDLVSELRDFVTALKAKGLWWGLIPYVEVKDSVLDKFLNGFKPEKGQRLGIACIAHCNDGPGCLFQIYGVRKFVELHIGLAWSCFYITTNSNTRRAVEVLPGELRRRLEGLFTFVPYESYVVHRKRESLFYTDDSMED